LIRFYDHGYGHFNTKRGIGPSCWEWFDLLWLHSGRVEIRLLGQPPQSLAANQGVLIYPHTSFEGRIITPSSRASIQHFAIEGDPRQAGFLRPFIDLAEKQKGYQRFALQDPDTFDDLVSHAMHLAALKQSPLIHDLRTAQLALVLGELQMAQYETQHTGPHQDRLANLLQLIRQHPDQAMTLQQMAEHLDLSASHFRALFRDRVGQTPGQYQQHVRMTEAARLLRDTDWSIKRIAEHLKFNELANFYRRFKSIHSQTPNRYREQHTPRT
jgi:AraC-like DNA-binding protein